eukprot:CFRG0256T1
MNRSVYCDDRSSLSLSRADSEANRILNREKTFDWIVYNHESDVMDVFFEPFRPTRIIGANIAWVVVNSPTRQNVEVDLNELHISWETVQKTIIRDRALAFTNRYDSCSPTERKKWEWELERLGETVHTTSTQTITADQYDDENVGVDYSRLWYRYKDLLRKEIDQLAGKYSVKEGKFVLFVNESHADSVWREVLNATIHDRLGTSARVSHATGNDMEKAHHERQLYRRVEQTFIIEIFTADYRDIADIGRVKDLLRKLELGVDVISLPYKPDIFSKLKIYSGNRWGLQPSVSTYKAQCWK